MDGSGVNVVGSGVDVDGNVSGYLVSFKSRRDDT
jgi:hypothetical protein